MSRKQIEAWVKMVLCLIQQQVKLTLDGNAAVFHVYVCVFFYSCLHMTTSYCASQSPHLYH